MPLLSKDCYRFFALLFSSRLRCVCRRCVSGYQSFFFAGLFSVVTSLSIGRYCGVYMGSVYYFRVLSPTKNASCAVVYARVNTYTKLCILSLILPFLLFARENYEGMWRSRTTLKRTFGAFYAVPSVMDAPSFVNFVRSCTGRLATFLENDTFTRNHTLRSEYFDGASREKIRRELYLLFNLKEKEVEDTVWNQHGLYDDRLATCIVPYRVAADIILTRLPDHVKCKALVELEEDEFLVCKGLTAKTRLNQIIEWVERDVYVSTGTCYLRYTHPRLLDRTPVIAVLGHTQHGKTTLLDALQKTNIRAEESHGVTQCLRAFTIPPHSDFHKAITFIDTPGERLFTEARFHALNIADFAVVIVSAIDGVRSQTYEAIKVALNVDKPIVVVINKMDLFSSTYKASDAVSNVLMDLKEAGLDVTVVRNEEDIDRIRASSPATRVSATSRSAVTGSFPLFSPMKLLDPSYQGSTRSPRVDLRRACIGICMSARDRLNIDLFRSVIELIVTACPPQCMSKSADYTCFCSVQAVVLESSKNLFDEEGFRTNIGLRKVAKRQDAAVRRRTHHFEKNSVCMRIHSSTNTARGVAKTRNPSSANCLMLKVIVREGCITKGMPFVADQSKGRVDHILDASGNYISHAYPGSAVIIIDTHSEAGCPGVGTHLLSAPSVRERDAVFEYRRLLQWFVECFPRRLHLLRPKGMDVSFAHLGDYGQLNDNTSLEYQLLYGIPKCVKPVSLASPDAHKPLELEATVHAKSIAEYIIEKNEGESSRQEGALLEGMTVERRLVDDSTKAVVENAWTRLQLETRIESQEAYDEFIRSCLQVGVFLKVDSWHSARLLRRESSRLGTRKVAFHVVGIRFGELLVDDILFFGRAMKVVICYRTPVAASAELDQYIEANDAWVLQTDDISDIVFFLKWCAVALHKEHASDDFNAPEMGENSWVLLQNGSPKLAYKANDKAVGEGHRRQLLVKQNLNVNPN
uniref:Putative translation initiation factor IF-2 n=1 Tax=Trypanosoma congolense (strain IL3000) TaxID=1068625 RepID=G0UST9_TRYCI|nr:putative translation initiation factor IF-2 [Trypanosoma congolense IL3000]